MTAIGRVRRPGPLAALVLLLQAWTPVVLRADGWRRASVPGFEVWSDADEAPAREAALRAHRLQRVLDRLLPPAESTEVPLVRVFLLHDPAALARYVPAGRPEPSTVAGFYLSGTDGPTIVMAVDPATGLASRTLEHECAHLQLNRALPAQPVWAAEGLAEALSEGESEGSRVRLARARPSRVEVVQRGPRLPTAELLAVTYDSRLYSGPRSDLVYAQSEALVRWLLARQGVAGVRALLAAIAEGEEPEAAVARSFGPLPELERSLLETPPGPLLEVELPREADPLPAVDVPAAAEVEYRLADVLLHGDHAPAAKAGFEAALQADPAHAPARAGLAQLALARGDRETARRELRLALAAHPDDPHALLRVARLELSEDRSRGAAAADAAEARAVAALERALARDPFLAQAAELLARERPEPLADRILRLQRVFAREPGRPELGSVLASLHVKRHDIPAARRVLRRARDATRDPVYRFLCDRRLQEFQGYEAATVQADGRLVRLDCRKDGSLRFTLELPRGRVALEAASHRSLFVRGSDDASELELLCGAQDRPVRVRYLPPPAPGLDGTLLTLQALPASR